MSEDWNSTAARDDAAEWRYWVRRTSLALTFAGYIASAAVLSGWARFVLDRWDDVQTAIREIAIYGATLMGLHFNFYVRSSFPFTSIVLIVIALGLSSAKRRAAIAEFFMTTKNSILEIVGLRAATTSAFSLPEIWSSVRDMSVYALAIFVAIVVLLVAYADVSDRANKNERALLAQLDRATYVKCKVRLDELDDQLTGKKPWHVVQDVEKTIACLEAAIAEKERIVSYFEYSSIDMAYGYAAVALFFVAVLLFPLDVISAAMWAVFFIWLGKLNIPLNCFLDPQRCVG